MRELMFLKELMLIRPANRKGKAFVTIGTFKSFNHLYAIDAMIY